MSYQYPNQPHYPPPQGGYYSNAPPPQDQYNYNRPPPPPPGQPPYGQPGHYQPPPTGPPGHYGAPPPQTSYPPPAGPGYGTPPGPPGPQYGGPHGGPPGPPPPSQGPYGNYPPPSHSPQIYPAPTQQQQPPYGAPAPPPSFPSLGYSPGQMAPGDFRREAEALRKAMKGFGTDERALIQVLSKLDPLQMVAVRSAYTSYIRRNLYNDVKSETGGYFRQGLLAIIDGPLAHDVSSARDAVQGVGTKEWLLNDVLLGRSNADLMAIKASYERTFNRSLQRDVEDDLSFKTKNLFTVVLRANRHEESAPVDYRAIQAEAQTIHNAISARVINNADEVCSIFARSSDAEIRAINQAFSERYHTSLESFIEKEFSGHMEDALLHMLRTALDPAMRDAVLLEECMKGMGTKDEKLVVRVVRVHWNRQHLDRVKQAYRFRYKQDLIQRVRGETSGDYQKLMIALLE